MSRALGRVLPQLGVNICRVRVPLQGLGCPCPWWQLERISCCGNGTEEVVAAHLGGAGTDPQCAMAGGEGT